MVIASPNRRNHRQTGGWTYGKTEWWTDKWNRRKLYTPSAYFVCQGYNYPKTEMFWGANMHHISQGSIWKWLISRQSTSRNRPNLQKEMSWPESSCLGILLSSEEQNYIISDWDWAEIGQLFDKLRADMDWIYNRRWVDQGRVVLVYYWPSSEGQTCFIFD